MADVTKTRAQLKQRVGEKLGVVEAGQSLSTEDATFIDGVLDAALEALNADNIVYVGDIDAISVAIFEDLATLIAARFLPVDFGKPPSVQEAQISERYLRRMTAGRPTYQVASTDYF